MSTALVSRCSGAVCQIHVIGVNGSQQTGSGFAAEPNGYVVTCYHVTHPDWPVREIRVQFSNQPVAVARRTVWEDQTKDLAVLETDPVPGIRLRIDKEEPIQPGDDVILAGFPTGLKSLSFFRGFVSARGPGLLPGVRNELIQLDATVQRGNSGGPVLSISSGCVIGVVNMKYVPLFQQIEGLRKITDEWPVLPQNTLGFGNVDWGKFFNFVGRAVNSLANTLVLVSVGVGWAVPVADIQVI